MCLRTSIELLKTQTPRTAKSSFIAWTLFSISPKSSYFRPLTAVTKQTWGRQCGFTVTPNERVKQFQLQKACTGTLVSPQGISSALGYEFVDVFCAEDMGFVKF